MPAFFVAVEAAAIDSDDLLPSRGEFGEVEPEVVVQAEETAAPSKIIDFVLAEVRRRLDPNPDTEIVELKVDPDFRGSEDTYLVNAVLDAHGRKLTVGVVVTVSKTPEGMKASVSYMD